MWARGVQLIRLGDPQGAQSQSDPSGKLRDPQAGRTLQGTKAAGTFRLSSALRDRPSVARQRASRDVVDGSCGTFIADFNLRNVLRCDQSAYREAFLVF